MTSSGNFPYQFTMMGIHHLMESSAFAYYDLLHLYQVLSSNGKSKFCGKIPEVIEVDVISLEKLFEDLMNLMDSSENRTICEKYLQLIAEYEKEYFIEEENNTPGIKLLSNIQILLAIGYGVIINSDGSMSCEKGQLSNTEINEINLLNDCIEDFLNLYRDPLLKRKTLNVSYAKEPELYKNLLKLIYEANFQNKPNLLGLLKITLPGLSSGERALQNIFSWLNLFLFSFDDEELRTAETILLVLDEMDLYFHPEWQRKYIDCLLNDLKVIFPNYRFQIICATHSPICLSEIPRENTIYLSVDEENRRGRTEDRMTHIQTFGRDVYSLLEDAFFLEKSTVGAYAESHINQILHEIQQEEINQEHYQDLTRRIDVIGNDLIREKLKQMLNRAAKDKQSVLHRLRKEKEALERQIKDMEQNL